MIVKMKEGVVFTELNSQLFKIMKVYHDAMGLFGATATVTSATDGEHLPNSLHYKSLALDLRTRDLSPDQKERLMLEMKNGLGSEFVVIIEADHIHVQFGHASQNPEAS